MSHRNSFPLGPHEIRAWIKRHPEALPRTLDDLSRYPMAFRRAMLAMVGLEVRLRLVGQHLRTFLAPDSPLNDEQRELVEATLAELPLLLAAPGKSAARRDWEERISQAFTLPEALRVFTQIGAPEPPEGLPLPADALPAPTA